MKHFTKLFRSYSEQIALLRGRNLIVEDDTWAVNALKTVNYYRFTGFALPFMKGRERFISGIRFEDVMTICLFDRKLRDLFSEAVEIIELDFRARFAYRFAFTSGPLGYRKEDYFRDGQKYCEMLKKIADEIARSRELCVYHFKREYFPDEIPIWAVVEILSFGTLAGMYNNLQAKVQNEISREYGMRGDIFGSYIKHISVMRNMCAHHSRLYDKRFYGFRPLNDWTKDVIRTLDTRTFFSQCLLIYRLLRGVDNRVFDRDDWKSRMIQMLEDAPIIQGISLQNIVHMPPNEKQTSLWL